MITLLVSNGYQTLLPQLGKIRGVLNLSQKRVTKAVREELRRQYGLPYVSVSCQAALAVDVWRGSCRIHGEDFGYSIKEQPNLHAVA